MSMEDVIGILNHPAPAFWCANADTRTDEREYLVPIKHRCHEPLAKKVVEVLREILEPVPGADQIISFYKKHNGANLFINPRLDVAEMCILQVEHWPGQQEEVFDWLRDSEEITDFSELSDDLPYSVDRLVPVGCLNGSPDTWFLATDGAAVGKVFFWEHDGAPFPKRAYADDFFKFIMRLFEDAPDSLGGHARYTDHDVVGAKLPSGTGLYPIRYVADWRKEQRPKGGHC